MILEGAILKANVQLPPIKEEFKGILVEVAILVKIVHKK